MSDLVDAWARDCTGPDCPCCNTWCRWCGAKNAEHDESECEANIYRPHPAGRGAARLTVETRKAFTITIGGRRRRFWSSGAAYYALAKRLVGCKYMPALSTVIAIGNHAIRTEAEVVEHTGLPVEVVRERADRASEMFTQTYGPSDGPECAFDTGRWQKHIRRVAAKLRKLDEHAARRARS